MSSVDQVQGKNTLYNSGPKRICMKSLIPTKNFSKSLNKIDLSFSILKSAIEASFYDKSISETLEELYNAVECICAHKFIPKLYEMLEMSFNEFVDDIHSKFLKNSLSLEFIALIWIVYTKKMLMIRNIFLYMDRQLHATNSEYETTWYLALRIFRNKIIRNSQLNSSILDLILTEIKTERSGQSIQTNHLRTSIRMFIDLQVYQSHFLPEFLAQTQVLYFQEANKILKVYTVSDYLKHVEKRIKEEEHRLYSYLDSSISFKPLMSTLDNEFITKAVDYLLEKSYVPLIESEDDEREPTLSLLYRLLLRIQPLGIDKLRQHYRDNIKKSIKSVVQNPDGDVKKDKYMIEILFRKKDEYESITRNCFNSDSTFLKAFSEAIEEGINSRPNKPAEYLAKYIDSNLKSGNKLKADDELDKIIEKSMVLFHYIDGKDVFEAFYSKELAKRLLLGKSSSIDAEKLILTKLKEECGPNYTRNLEGMFQDIELSRQLSKNFRQYLQSVIANGDPLPIPEEEEPAMAVDPVVRNEGEKEPKKPFQISPEILSIPLPTHIELSVNVITPKAWPPYPKATANYPPEMIRLKEEFIKFYLTHHKSRRLNFDPTLGSCIVRADLPDSGRKELQVSEYQALVLLQFNQDIDKPLTFAEIQNATAIEENELKRALLSLAANKDQKILIKKPMTVEVLPDHEFVLNKAFKHKLTRIKFNQVQLKETKEEQQETEERVFADRVANVDCCIVRIMKTRKTMDHNSLMTEVYGQLNFPLKASEVKKRIENLIERDYMKRDPDNPSSYQYVS